MINRSLVGLLLVVGWLITPRLLAQSELPRTYDQLIRQVGTVRPASKVTCSVAEHDAFVRVLPPAVFRQRTLPNARLAAPTAQFVVSYNGFPPDAQRAFQYAVDIWATNLVSPVPIRVQANWAIQAPGLLGSAGPSTYRFGSDGAQRAYAFYPIALAEKIARRPLNDPNEADIVADFNRNNNWYFGLDGKIPAGQIDFVTAVLHELAHGLGFIGFFDVVGSVGTYSAGVPSVYDHFVWNGQGKWLTTSTKDYPDGSEALARQLTGNFLFLNGPILRQRTGQMPKLYSASPFNRAISIYHLNGDLFRDDTLNSLMVPALSRAMAIHQPGPILLNLMTDLEWKTTSVLHDPLPGSEDAKDLVFSTRIVSDTTLTPGSTRLFYRTKAPSAQDTTFTSVALTRVGTTDEYRYTIPVTQLPGEFWYYFQAQDASGRTFNNPGRLPTGAQTYHHVIAGPDNVPPAIQFGPSKYFIFDPTVADSLPIYAAVQDDRPAGLDAVYLEYQINSVAQPNLPLLRTHNTENGAVFDSLYVNRINFPANSLKAGDKISYRIVARDGSQAKNQTVSPTAGFYELTVVAPQPVRDEYVNNFNAATPNAAAPTNDFVGVGFGIASLPDFGDAAIHSEHPYQNGADRRLQTNSEYVLLSPIRIKANPDSAMMRFDEIVLVEPGEPGSRFGDERFRDYVIVEASNDKGRTWKPLLDGYNARADEDWLTAYNQHLMAGAAGEQNSTTAGMPALYKHREIPLQKSGVFGAGDVILLRFRLFADQRNHGWGWAIDNLRVQLPPPPPVLATEPVRVSRFVVYPNPVNTGLMRVEADFARPVSAVNLTITGPGGQQLRQLKLTVGGTKLSEQLDLSQLPTGLYFLRLKTDDSVVAQKIMIAR